MRILNLIDLHISVPQQITPIFKKMGVIVLRTSCNKKGPLIEQALHLYKRVRKATSLVPSLHHHPSIC